MGVTNMHSISELTAARELRTVMQGNVVLRGDDDYVHTRQIWNGAVGHQPVFFAVCDTSGDVQAAVRSARQHGFPLSVRGGGHDWAGRALRHNGLVIDLSKMRHVSVEPETMPGHELVVDAPVDEDAHRREHVVDVKVSLVGHSLGGVIALDTVLQYADVQP